MLHQSFLQKRFTSKSGIADFPPLFKAPPKHHQIKRKSPCRRQQACAPACSASRPPDSYASMLMEAEQTEDWLKTVELVTEVNVLGIQVSSDALEAAVRTLAKGGQADRSSALLNKLFEPEGAQPSPETILAVLEASAMSKDAVRAQTLLEVLEQQHLTGSQGETALKRARNMVVRVLASSGFAIKAADLLDDYLKLQGQDKPTLISFDTYGVVAHELVKLGDAVRANEVLESRDYLQE